MAHFYGGLQGNRGEGNRCGTQASGISVYAQGWRACVSTRFHYDPNAKRDLASITLEPGPSGYTRSILLGNNIDVGAILDANEWDDKTAVYVRQIKHYIAKANEQALIAKKRKDKLAKRAA